MYLPAHFAESNPAVLHGVIRDHPLATLVVATAEGLVANPVPLLLRLDDHGNTRLAGHVARQNPVWRQVDSGRTTALAVFHGPSAYVSPSWYPGKHEHGRAVPTWNYITVQAHGIVSVQDDPSWLRQQVEDLTRQQESSQPHPWSVGDAPPEYIAGMLTQIVGIELEVTLLQGKCKLSQNQPPANRDGVLAALESQKTAEAQAMARAMRQGHSPDSRSPSP